jgi:hypothetical protein
MHVSMGKERRLVNRNHGSGYGIEELLDVRVHDLRRTLGLKR